jgi:hypothetical protein
MKKLEAQELEKLQNLFTQKQSSAIAIGTAAVQKEIDVRKATQIFEKAEATFSKVLETEMNNSKIIESKIEDFVNELNKKYGNHQYNLETGELIEPPKE